MRRPLRIAGSALAVALAVPCLSAQIVISEIEFQPRAAEGQWIELANLGTTAVDLGTWSVYLATKTPSQPQNYWWGFPRGTILEAGKFLRVHWLAAVKPTTPTDVYTGNTVQHFLFGLFAETLDFNLGALALYDTQANNLMNDPTHIQDWVSWGTTGFRREDLAVQGQRWVKDTQAPAATSSTAGTPTLAYNYENLLQAHAGSDWFRDFSPTPGSENRGGANAEVYGTTCQGNLTQPMALVANGLPIKGHLDFYIGIDRLLDPNELVLAMFGLRGDGSFQFWGCRYWLDLQVPAIVFYVPTVGGRARVDFQLFPPGFLDGLQFSNQWLLADIANNRFGMSNGIELKFGTK